MFITQMFKAIITTLVLGCTLISFQALSAEYIAPPPFSKNIDADISRLAQSDEVKPILAGDTEFLTLYSEYMSADFRGVVILIPDWQSTPTNNAGMNFLRKELNNYGYTSYAMTVPDIDWQAAQDDAAKTTNNSVGTNNKTANANTKPNTSTQKQPHHADYVEQVNTEVVDNYKLKLLARYDALYQQAAMESENIVVIAQGTSAGVLLEHYAEFSDSKINAFISLSSYLPNTKRNAKLSQITSLVTPALLDIYFATDSNDILMNLKKRQRWVNRNAKFDYRQRQLFGLRDAPQQHARLSKEIDGFLRRLF
ncbi:DUF3530 family protein [Pseudoalteromonas sp. D48-MNA-CIBAN-0056]|uniref:DUF3530 family protein n=1 Tax=Pseudoalteromonas sp. D48-MNA-CIBAN-0056 TaxID=3140417 RepID=UPI00332B30EB